MRAPGCAQLCMYTMHFCTHPAEVAHLVLRRGRPAATYLRPPRPGSAKPVPRTTRAGPVVVRVTPCPSRTAV